MKISTALFALALLLSPTLVNAAPKKCVAPEAFLKSVTTGKDKASVVIDMSGDALVKFNTAAERVTGQPTKSDLFDRAIILDSGEAFYIAVFFKAGCAVGFQAIPQAIYKKITAPPGEGI